MFSMLQAALLWYVKWFGILFWESTCYKLSFLLVDSLYVSGVLTGYTTSTFQKGRSFRYYVGNWLLRAKVGWRLYPIMWLEFLRRNKYCLTGMKLRKDMVYDSRIIPLTSLFCSSFSFSSTCYNRFPLLMCFSAFMSFSSHRAFFRFFLLWNWKIFYDSKVLKLLIKQFR